MAGVAAHSMHRIRQAEPYSELYHVSTYDIERIAGAHTLSNLLLQANELGTHDVLFALLEGSKMYLESLLLVFFATLYLGPGSENDSNFDYIEEKYLPILAIHDEKFHWDWSRAPSTCKIHQRRPLTVDGGMTKYKLGSAFFAAMKDCKFYHFVIQKLLRLIARESIKRKDGKTLGKTARLVLENSALKS